MAQINNNIVCIQYTGLLREWPTIASLLLRRGEDALIATPLRPRQCRLLLLILSSSATLLKHSVGTTTSTTTTTKRKHAHVVEDSRDMGSYKLLTNMLHTSAVQLFNQYRHDTFDLTALLAIYHNYDLSSALSTDTGRSFPTAFSELADKLVEIYLTSYDTTVLLQIADLLSTWSKRPEGKKSVSAAINRIVSKAWVDLTAASKLVRGWAVETSAVSGRKKSKGKSSDQDDEVSFPCLYNICIQYTIVLPCILYLYAAIAASVLAVLELEAAVSARPDRADLG